MSASSSSRAASGASTSSVTCSKLAPARSRARVVASTATRGPPGIGVGAAAAVHATTLSSTTSAGPPLSTTRITARTRSSTGPGPIASSSAIAPPHCRARSRSSAFSQKMPPGNRSVMATRSTTCSASSVLPTPASPSMLAATPTRPPGTSRRSTVAKSCSRPTNVRVGGRAGRLYTRARPMLAGRGTGAAPSRPTARAIARATPSTPSPQCTPSRPASSGDFAAMSASSTSHHTGTIRRGRSRSSDSSACSAAVSSPVQYVQNRGLSTTTPYSDPARPALIFAAMLSPGAICSRSYQTRTPHPASATTSGSTNRALSSLAWHTNASNSPASSISSVQCRRYHGLAARPGSRHVGPLPSSQPGRHQAREPNERRRPQPRRAISPQRPRGAGLTRVDRGAPRRG